MSTEIVYNNGHDSTTPNGSFGVRDQRRPGWFWCDNEIIDDYAKEMTPYALAVYIYYCRRADKNGQSWASIGRIAKDLNIAPNTVRSANEELEKLKLIHVQERRNANGSHRPHMVTLLQVSKRGTSSGEGRVVRPAKESTSSGEPEEESVKKTHSNQCVKETEWVKETDPHPRTEDSNFSSTGSAFGSAGDRDEPHDGDVSGDFGSSSSSEALKAQSPPHPPSPWAESALEAFDNELEELDLTALKDWERKQFLRKFEELRTEQEIDNETVYAVIRRMLDQWERIHLSPDRAYVDVTEKYPERYPPMDSNEFFDWVDDYREKLEREEEEDYDDWDDIPLDEVEERGEYEAQRRRQRTESKNKSWMKDFLNPGQELR